MLMRRSVGLVSGGITVLMLHRLSNAVMHGYLTACNGSSYAHARGLRQREKREGGVEDEAYPLRIGVGLGWGEGSHTGFNFL